MEEAYLRYSVKLEFDVNCINLLKVIKNDNIRLYMIIFVPTKVFKIQIY